jgi:hypothetical protein
MTEYRLNPIIYFTCETLPNLDLKNTTSTYTMDFSWTNWLKLSCFDGFFFPNCQNFMMGSSNCQECPSILNFFKLSYLVYSQFIYFILFLVDEILPVWLNHKIAKNKIKINTLTDNDAHTFVVKAAEGEPPGGEGGRSPIKH